jgi:hypothetical protein
MSWTFFRLPPCFEGPAKHARPFSRVSRLHVVGQMATPDRPQFPRIANKAAPSQHCGLIPGNWSKLTFSTSANIVEVRISVNKLKYAYRGRRAS